MWKCSYCAKGVEPELDACWSCGYSKDGEPPSLELVALLTAAKRDQKAEREVEKSNRLKKTTPSLLLPSIAVTGIVAFLLFFHIVPAHLTVFPKRSPSFADTFVDLDEYLKRYNDQNFIGMLVMQASPLHQQLADRGLIVSKSKTNN